MATDRRPVGVRQSYPELQPSFGPTCGCGPGSLRQILQRPQLYDDKYHAQEWSLLHKIYVLLGGDMTSAGVIDIGAGNGSLALLVSALFGIPTTMVDRRCPRKELRAELFVPESLGQLLQRVTCDCADLDTDAVLAALQARGVRRVVVVAKHLCGLGTDLALRWMEALSQRQEVELVGCVVATCCVHKIAKADFANFVEWYRPAYEGSGTLAGRSLESLLSICCRFATWRTTANSATAVTTEDQVRLAEAFEDVIQWLLGTCTARASAIVGCCSSGTTWLQPEPRRSDTVEPGASSADAAADVVPCEHRSQICPPGPHVAGPLLGGRLRKQSCG
mmetsp:Transcript_76577/g.175565  ORF Transcript_76577/g.175565 Transcript_76577/m.175565 type:complete len:334 (-) Transcript_76577:288-1289(-)